MNKKLLWFVLILIIVVGTWVFLKKGGNENIVDNVDLSQDQSTETKEFTFSLPKKSAHYETNSPEHGSVLAAPPINIVIDFNFDLASPSSMSIKNGDIEYGVGETMIDKNKLSMRRQLSRQAPDGLYKVTYKACWPDGSCHDGHFQFAIDRDLSASYEDQTGKKEIVIKMSQIQFMPQNIKISKGTKIIWLNDDFVEHYVNTETHPSHTYFLEQNSRAIAKGESYSVTFETLGIYPYHCSAHAETMRGNILVE